MKILVLNCGSSSVKYQLLKMEGEVLLAKGLVERVGLEAALFTHWQKDWERKKIAVKASDHTEAIQQVLETLTNREHGILADTSEIGGIGHRVVHGGEKFTRSTRITPEVLEEIRECIEIAPLHNPPNIKGIEACAKLLPRTPQVAVFDTAFHQTIPPFAYLYGIDYSYYKHYNIRRYGFHGTSHHYVANRAGELLGKGPIGIKIITCHLGNGCSIAAIKDGSSVDTSMGFTPLEGLLMGTRAGDLDPAIVFFLMEKEGLTPAEANDLFNKQSGLKGLSGVSSDMREILKEFRKDNERAIYALQLFTYRIRKYIAAYAGAMGGVDVVVFTGGIGENSPFVREMSLLGLEFIGIKLDRLRNEKTVGVEGEISSPASRVRIFAIPTNEELVIARDTRDIILSA